MFVIEVGKVRGKAKGGPVYSISMEVLDGRESLESRTLDASRQWKVTRLFSVMIGVSTRPTGIGIAPHTEIEMNSKAGLIARRSKKGDNSTPGMIMLRDLRYAKARSFLSKRRPSRESDRMVDISPKSGGRSGKCPDDKPVTSMITSVMTGERVVSLENISGSPYRPGVLKRNVIMRLRWVGW
jgi:hypothetical protein